MSAPGATKTSGEAVDRGFVASISDEQLRAVPAEVWRSLAEVMEAHDVTRSHERVFTFSEVAFEPEFRALRRATLRSEGDAAAALLRAFWLHDPVPRGALAAALGERLFEALAQHGVLSSAGDDAWVSPLVLFRFRGSWLLADDLHAGADAVMGVGLDTSVLARAGLPRAASSTASTRRSVESIGDVLDLGSGAGAVALAVAPFARSVVATDVNPRAALFVSANAAAHGHTNLAVATGDLFAPVQGRRFDRILTQPPWVPDWSDGSGEGGPTYATSGPRGDLLTRRILREVSGYLTPRGLAVIVAQLPVSPDLPVEDDLTQGLPDDVDVIVGLGRADDYEYLAATCTAAELPRFGAAYDEEVVRRARLLRARGIHAFTRAMIALRPTAQPGRAGVRARFELPSSPEAWIGSDDLERWLDAAVLRAPGADAALHAARLRLRPELQLARLPEGGALLHAPPSCPITLAGVGPGTVRVLEAIKATRTVGDALRKIAPQPAARAAILAGVRELLGAGVLEVVPG